MDFTTRPGTGKDRPAMAQVISAAFPHESATSDWAVEAVDLRDRDWFVLEIDGQVIACLAATCATLEVGAGHLVKSDLGPVAVLPQWQGQGVGKVLMRAGM